MYRALTVATRLALAALIPVAAAQTRGVFVTPIPNVPLLAVVNTQSSEILPDGTTLNRKTLSAIARDGQGRIFNERRPLIPASETATPPIISIHVYDPQTRISIFIDPQSHVAWQSTLNRPPSAVPPEVGSIPLAGSTLRQPVYQRRKIWARAGWRAWMFMEPATHRPSRRKTNGGKEVTVVDEYWYSEDLRLNMLAIHKDPRTGEQTTTVTQLNRSEPDPAIFEIPSGLQGHPAEGPVGKWMEQAIPSRTALRVALRRAAHQLHDSPVVFDDPMAVALLGATYAEELRRTPLREDRPFLDRASRVSRCPQPLCRRQPAEGGRGWRETIRLAGRWTRYLRLPQLLCDNFASLKWTTLLPSSGSASCCNATASLFQRASPTRRSILNASHSRRSLAIPDSTTARLPSSRGWVSFHTSLWKPSAELSALSLPSLPEAAVTLDYGQPRAVLPLLEQLAHDSLASRVEKAGEPFRLFFTPAEIAAEFSRFHSLEDLGAAEINARYFSGRTDQLAVRGTAGRLFSAWL